MRKWSASDIIVLVLEILSPILSLIVTIIFGDSLSEDVKLGIITAGIAIPIAILQTSITQDHNKNDVEIEKLHNLVDKCDDKIAHISPIMERIFLEKNDMIKRFAYRRMSEAVKSVNFAITNHRSGNLRPNEYYEELFYLADMIKQDFQINNNENYLGEIWAMTSFAENEWSADQGYEQRWTEELGELVDCGIKTRRLCIISDEIYNIIRNERFELQTAIHNSPSFHAFWEFLSLYYRNGTKENIFQYALRERDCVDLSKIKGFFAIKLSNGELHILYGETVDSNGALTSELLFDMDEIERTRKLFQRYSRHTIEVYLQKNGSKSFKRTLNEEKIIFNGKPQLNSAAGH